MSVEPRLAPTTNCVLRLTPAGVGAIAVIRIAGELVDQFLRQHFTVATQVGKATHGKLIDAAEVIDDPLIARVSPTIADINLHGGTWLIQRVIDLAVIAGFSYLETEPILPSAAVDGVDELEAEMLIALPHAGTDEGVRLLLAQPEAWKRLTQDPVDEQAVRRVLHDRGMHWMLNPPTVAIVGPPNVGKSSLANELFGRDRSITADLPGTTRDWVGDWANIDGLLVMLIDTPGVRSTEDSIEAQAIEQAKSKIEQADFVLLVDEAGGRAAEAVTQYRSAVKVNNKMDRGVGVGINTNALTGEGMDQLRSAIRRRFDWEPIELTKACCWTARQQTYLEKLLI